MLTKILGHLLFPRLPEWEQQKRTNTVLLVLLATIGLAALLGAIMYWVNTMHS